MLSVPVRWTLHSLLQRHGITPYRLMKESGLARGTVYRLTNGTTRNLNADTVERVVATLRRLTGKDVQISDVLTYEPEGEAQQ